jgi:predicted enzyme related to lactoylglutathione lyase
MNIKERKMNQGVETIIYPVKDISRAKQMFNQLLDAEPYAEMPYYIGYKVGKLEIGLDPNGFNQGMTEPINYFHVADIKKSIQVLMDEGAQKIQDIREVGGGKLIATLKSPDGNVIGLIQIP